MAVGQLNGAYTVVCPHQKCRQPVLAPSMSQVSLRLSHKSGWHIHNLATCGCARQKFYDCLPKNSYKLCDQLKMTLPLDSMHINADLGTCWDGLAASYSGSCSAACGVPLPRSRPGSGGRPPRTLQSQQR